MRPIGDAERGGGVEIEVGRRLAARDMLAAREDHARRTRPARPRWARWPVDPVRSSSTKQIALGSDRAAGADESDRARDLLEPLGAAPAHPPRRGRRGNRRAAARPIQRSIAARKSRPASPMKLAIDSLDAGRMADRGQIVGDLLVAGPFAFEQHAVEIEDQRVELHVRAPNNAVPTRTWVAPSITAVS